MNDLRKSETCVARDLLKAVRIRGSDFAGSEPPPRRWLVPELMPRGNVTLLYGDGGLGKSTLALQLAVSTALGGHWLGRPVVQGEVLYLSAEDDAPELHRRLHEAAIHYDVDLAALGGVHLIPLADKDATLGVEGEGGAIVPTALWRALDAFSATDMGAEHEPALFILDSLADVFGGNEINRNHARQFIAQLRRFAIRTDIAVLVLAHPSRAGMSTGSGDSGSTAWSNSVRSRLYMTKPEGEEGADDPDARILRLPKANYTRAIPDMRLRRRIGGYVLEQDPDEQSGASATARAERVFIDLLRAYTQEGRKVRASTGHGYAPAEFARDHRSKGVSKYGLTKAMNRLFAAKAIVNVREGPPSKTTYHIALAEGG